MVLRAAPCLSVSQPSELSLAHVTGSPWLLSPSGRYGLCTLPGAGRLSLFLPQLLAHRCLCAWQE